MDRTRIYFDTFQISDLEKLTLKNESLELNIYSNSLINKFILNKTTRSNQSFEIFNSNIFTGNNYKKNILVIDQTFGDQSIKYADASSETFKAMLQQAYLDHPKTNIWVKTNPDVVVGKQKRTFHKQIYFILKFRI
ncbi:capsular polysaccharide export protein, LipB/KpsS family [Acinetobacter terrestris]|uniref:capsular polysaccharide export protein, LipB/KpsS family n=1 Tax=Acinetobacter terrestris TaxID=2529843 RepID=UPI003313FE83